MRLLLVFPSRASPTYVPLGIAGLAAHVRTAVPDVEVELLDLSLAAWEEAVAASPEGIAAAAWFRDPAGGLGDAALYDLHAGALDRAGRALRRHDAGVRAWLATGGLPAEAEARLDREVRAVLDRAPDRIGVSALYPDQLAPAVALARRLREAGAPEVALGGAALGAIDAAALRAACPFLGPVVVGEGEAALSAWLGGGEPGGRATPLEAWAAPDFSLLPLRRYLVPEPVLPVLGSRGCAWRRCRYCAHNLTFGRHRRRPAAAVADEMEAGLRDHGARLFYFADEWVDGPALLELSREILRRGLRSAFHVMGRPSADMTPAVLEVAAHAGCRWISWGVETASDRLLALSRKGCDAATMETVLRDSHSAGISNLGMFILGLPTSRREDLDATLDFLDRTHADLDAVSAGSFALYARSGFGRDPAAFGLEVLGAEPALRVGDRVVPSSRLRFRRTDAAPDAAAADEERFRRHLEWLRGRPLLDRVACEHYLAIVGGGWLPVRRAG